MFTGSSTGTRRKYNKLSDVVTLSDNSEDLARNLSDYINEKIPYGSFIQPIILPQYKKIMAISGVSIFFLIVLSIIAFVLTLIGTFSFAFPFLILLKKKTRETSWFYGGE